MWGTRVFEVYGCTETGMVAARRTVDGPSWDNAARREGRGRAAMGSAHTAATFSRDGLLTACG